jgi:alkylhydroperoxidase family enzyme
MHTKDALAAGESAQRLFAVPAWKQTPFFTSRERAALAWTDALSDLGRTHVPDEVYNEVRAHFTEAELTNLTMAVIAINGWNMLSVGFRVEPGSYQPRSKTAA